MPDSMMRPNRSVADYESEDDLRKALLSVGRHSDGNNSSINACERILSGIAANKDSTEAYSSNGAGSLDWVLSSYDPETTEAQSMKEELQRLQVLKSYLILDADREKAFERITSLAARIFKVPIAVISLVDLGRQWFLSTRGLGDVRETPRNQAFCAHTILSNSNFLVVPDATKDFRFQNNPLVTGSPNIRFYAGAPLICPEGYKLGTCCIISDEPRPQGMTIDEQLSLMDLANMAVEALVDRRNKLERRENPAELIAYAAHDLMTPLTGVQLSLTLLSEDEEVQRKLGSHQLELLSTATNCANLMIRICKTMDILRRGATADASDALADERGQRSPLSSIDNFDTPRTNMAELVKSLNLIMEPIPKQVPLVIRLDPDVPQTLVSDDLKLFRSALNLLSSAASRTNTGCIQLRIYCKEDRSQLVFECRDSGDDIPVEEYQYLFQPSRAEDGNLRLCLSSVASLISSLDGLFGFHPRREAVRGPVGSARSLSVGSVFWFSVPLITPDEIHTHGQKFNRPQARKESAKSVAYKPPIIPLLRKSCSSTSVSSINGCLTLSGHPLDADGEFCIGDAFAPLLNAHKRSGSNGDCAGGIASKAVQPSFSYGQEATRAFEATTIPPQITPRKKRGLIIDDSLVIRKSLGMALKKLDHDVSVAVDGLDGLNKMKEQPYDLVLCDFLMPVMDGFDCVKQYRSWERKNRSWFRQLIVGISAHANESVAAQGIAAGMDDFKPKPISISCLKEIDNSEEVHRRSKQLSEHEVPGPVTALPMPNVVSSAQQQSTNASVQPQSVLSGTIRTRDMRDSSDEIKKLDNKLFQKTPSWVAEKRARIASGSIPGSEECVCLIATDRPTQNSSAVLTSLESHGWKVVVVHDGQDALRLLQMRNWDAVLIDEDLPLLSGCQCISKFRHWEAKNRVNRQKNAILVVDLDIPGPSDGMSVVQPPSGFDFVLSKPVVWNDLRLILETSEDTPMAIIMNN